MVKDRRIVKTQSAIKEAFFELLKEKDAAEISVTELCEKANITRKTFYTYYDNLADLADHFMQKFMDELDVLLTPIREKEVTPELQFNVLFVDFIKENKVIVRSLWDIANGAEKFRRGIFKDSKKLIRQRLKRRNLDDNWDIKKMVKNLSDFQAAGTQAIFENWLNEKDPLTDEELAYILYMMTIIPFEAPLSMDVSASKIKEVLRDTKEKKQI